MKWGGARRYQGFRVIKRDEGCKEREDAREIHTKREKRRNEKINALLKMNEIYSV
jgi:hypothetical protein